MQKKIIFKPFILYFKEQNSVFKQIRKTIINMTKIAILKKNFNNNL